MSFDSKDVSNIKVIRILNQDKLLIILCAFNQDNNCKVYLFSATYDLGLLLETLVLLLCALCMQHC